MKVYCEKNRDIKVDVISIGNWQPIPDKPGYVRNAGNRLVSDILKELVDKLTILCPEVMETLDYGFEAKVWGEVKPTDPWPEYRWISCYAVRGGSEGHYLHLDVLQNGFNEFKHKNICTAKTLDGVQTGMSAMFELAKYCTLLLDE